MIEGRKQRQRRGNTSLSLAQKEVLFDELLPVSSAEERATAFVNDNEKMSAWKIHGESLLPEFVRSYPLQRPTLWWSLNAPEPRRRKGRAAYHNDAGELVEYDFHETAAQYLTRLNLLLPGEENLAERVCQIDDTLHAQLLATWRHLNQ